MAFGASISTVDFQDIIVHDDYIIVRIQDTFQAYIRPKPEGNSLVKTPLSGPLVITPTTENAMVHKAEFGRNTSD